MEVIYTYTHTHSKIKLIFFSMVGGQKSKLFSGFFAVFLQVLDPQTPRNRHPSRPPSVIRFTFCYICNKEEEDVTPHDKNKTLNKRQKNNLYKQLTSNDLQRYKKSY